MHTFMSLCYYVCWGIRARCYYVCWSIRARLHESVLLCVLEYSCTPSGVCVTMCVGVLVHAFMSLCYYVCWSIRARLHESVLLCVLEYSCTPSGVCYYVCWSFLKLIADVSSTCCNIIAS